MTWAFIGGLAAFYAFWLFYVVPTQDDRKYNKLLSLYDDAHGTRFAVLDAKNAVGFNTQWRVVFDSKTRQALIVGELKTTRQVDFSYFRSWRLVWTEHSDRSVVRFSGVGLQFTTNDFDDPILLLRCESKVEGEKWNAKLAILFDAPVDTSSH